MMDDLKQRLARLRGSDPAFKVFGASRHQYLRCPVTSEALQDFERACGVELPQEYRLFLQEIGYGAGPYQGILSPAISRLGGLPHIAALGAEPLSAFQVGTGNSCGPVAGVIY